MACVLPCSYVHTGPKAPAADQVGSDLHSAAERQAQVSCQASRLQNFPFIIISGVGGRARLTPVGRLCLFPASALPCSTVNNQHCDKVGGRQGICSLRGEQPPAAGRLQTRNPAPSCARAGLLH